MGGKTWLKTDQTELVTQVPKFNSKDRKSAEKGLNTLVWPEQS